MAQNRVGSQIATIHAIVVTYNSGALIERCLTALKAAAGERELRITVADNNSADDTLAKARLAMPQVQIIQTGGNLGYAGGNNVGIRAALAVANPPDAIAIVNPDLIIMPGCFDTLATAIEQVPDAGMVSAAVVPPGGTAADIAIPKTLWGWPTAARVPDHPNVWDVDRLPGSCMLVAREVFERIGLFEERYFLYWEEVEFCHRARRAGFRLLIDASSLAFHDADDLERPHRVYFMNRNQFFFARQCMPAVLRPVFLVKRLLANSLRTMLMHAVKGYWPLVSAAMAGLWAGLRGETGYSARAFSIGRGRNYKVKPK